ncbi:MAG: serine/threonine-protein kinase [Ktedonobacteraceae bacterium]
MDDSTGQCLGNYRLVRLLGHGGFADVYLGEHLRLGTQAALKLLSTRLTDTDREQFLAEARAIAHLEHPHIIRILDFAVEQGVPFLVMSYALNGTLRQRYPKGTRLPLDMLRTYLQQAADALQCAHDAKLIHRDIKPENMLLGRHNELLLSDFGIAVMAHNSRSQRTEDIIGTLSYMAPEQIQGKPRPASDQYALGVIVYEWLCGYLPFQGTTAEIAAQHLHADPPALCTYIPDMPLAIEAVVRKALEKDPHQRFASVQEFSTAFEQASQGWLSTAVAPTTLATAPMTTLEQFYNAPTLAENKLQQSKKVRRGIPRRALLLGTIGAIGLAATGGTLTYWEISQKPTPGNTFVTYTGHLSAVVTVAWAPDSTHIVSGSDDTTVQVWPASSGVDPLIYRGHTSNINAVAWSPPHTNQRIASASGNSFFPGEHVVQIWAASSGTHILTYTGHTQPVLTAAWSPDGTRIASGSEDKLVQVWKSTTGNPVIAFTKHTALVSSVAWSPDGTRIASASQDRTVQVWDAQTASSIFTLAHTNIVNAVAWSPDGTRIASASGNAFFGGDHNVQVWDSTTGNAILTYHGHTTPVNAVAWSPDSTRIASASATIEKTVHIWDATQGKPLFTYHGHTLSVRAVAWSPDGTRIASASNDGTVRVWQAP